MQSKSFLWVRCVYSPPSMFDSVHLALLQEQGAPLHPRNLASSLSLTVSCSLSWAALPGHSPVYGHRAFIASFAKSSSPGRTSSAFAAFCPSGLSVSAISSFNIDSLVVLVSSSTSAGVKPAVGIGGRTITVNQHRIQVFGHPIVWPQVQVYIPFTGMVPPLNLLSPTPSTPQ